MSATVPALDEGANRFGKGFLRGEVCSAQELALEDTEPLLYLVEPGAVLGSEVKAEARMLGEPGLGGFALVHAQVVQDDVDGAHMRRHTLLKPLHGGQELNRALPFAGPAEDLAGSRIEGSEQVEGANALVLGLDADRSARRSAARGRTPWPGLKTGLFVEAEDDLIIAKRPGVEVDDAGYGRLEVSVAGHARRQPGVNAPGLEVVPGKDAADGLGRDALHHTASDKFSGQLSAVPLAQGYAALLRQFAGQLDEVDGYGEGEKLASFPGQGDR